MSSEKGIDKLYFSPDSRWLVTIKDEGGSKLWDVSSGKSYDFLSSEKGIRAINFSSDSKWLATLDKNGVYKIWNLFEEEGANELRERDRRVILSSNKKWITTIKATGTTFCNIHSGKIYDFLSSEKDILSVWFSPDGKWLGTINSNGRCKLWDISNGKPNDFLSNIEDVHIVFFSPDSKWVVLEFSDYEVKVWNRLTKKEYEFSWAEKNITGIQFSSDSEWLVLEEGTGRIDIWNMEKGNMVDLRTLGNEATAHFSSDSKWLVGIFGEKAWALVDNKVCDFVLRDETNNYVEFSPDSRWLVTVGEKPDSLYLWDLTNRRLAKALFSSRSIHRSGSFFSSDSRWLFLVGEENEVSIWDLQNARIKDVFLTKHRVFELHSSPNSNWLVTKEENELCKLWDVNTRKEASFLSSEKRIDDIIFSEDSKLLSITTGHKVKTYMIGEPKPIQTLWLNKKATQVDIIDNQIFVGVGKVVIKTDLEKDRGDIMSWGDGEPLDYKYDEIQEWIKVFGDKYLLPLSEEVKKKYGIK